MKFPESSAAGRRDELIAHVSEHIINTHGQGTLYGTFPQNATQMEPYGTAYMLHPECFESAEDAVVPNEPIEMEHIGDRVEAVVTDSKRPH